MVSLEQAKKLIDLAKTAIDSYFTNSDISITSELKKEFGKEQGVFVSLYSGKNLRGCIGYSEPVLPLWKAVVYASRAAAFEDPRFPPITVKEMKNLTFEISVLTKPRLIEVNSPEDYISKINIGVDGLIVKGKFGTGLLLPQVAKEWKWNSIDFLNQTCIKAGLEPNCWNNMKQKVYKFQAQIFREENGKIVEIILK